MNNQGLYTYSPLEEESKKELVHSIVSRTRSSVKKTHVEGYTPREVKCTKMARRLYHSLTTQEVGELKAFICGNMMRNNPIMTADVNLAEGIFGKDVPTIKEKSTNRKGDMIRDERIDLPEELALADKNLELATDILFVDRALFLVAIDRHIKFCSAVPIKDRSAEKVLQALDIILGHYNQEGYLITMLHCDGEFISLIGEALENVENMEVNFAAPTDHVPDIERSNRTLEERFRVAFYRLPYRRMPTLMMVLMPVCVNLNLFPNLEGISRHYGPQVILKRETIDYAHYCKFQFGDYVQVGVDETLKNNNLPRSIDCIYLRPSPDMPNGHNLMDLYTGKLIRRPAKMITLCEITRDIVCQVETMARKQGVKSLKFKYRKDPDWLPICINEEVNEPSEKEEGDEGIPEDDSDDEEYVPELMAPGEGLEDSNDELSDDDDSNGGDDSGDKGLDDLDKEDVAGLLQPEPRGVNCRIDLPVAPQPEAPGGARGNGFRRGKSSGLRTRSAEKQPHHKRNLEIKSVYG